MRIVREYQRREFCNDWRCPTQIKLDAAPDHEAIDSIKKEECQECMAHIFHKWLMDRDFQVVVIE